MSVARLVLTLFFATVSISMPFTAFGEKLNKKQLIEQELENFKVQAAKSPNTELTVTFSFNSHKKIDDVITAAENHGLRLSGFRDRHEEDTGGFLFSIDDDPHIAAQFYIDSSLAMAKSFISSIESEINSKERNSDNGNPTSLDSLKKRLRDMKALERDFLHNSVRIVGGDFTGTGEQLLLFMNSNKQLSRAVTVVDGTKRSNAIVIDY